MLGDGRPRLVLDVQSTQVLAPSTPPPGAALALAIRRGRHEGGITRLVVDLAQDARIASVALERVGGGLRLAYEIAPHAGAPIVAAPVLEAATAPASTPPAPERLTPVKAQRGNGRIVAIDAGHGGRDPGAMSASGRAEKDIALAAAHALRAQLRARGYEVVMTRETDALLPLAERVKIAREAKADLFISLHADAHSNAGARGASIYTLSESGGERAKALMASQDWRIDLGEAAQTGGAHEILIDLTQRETTSRSAEFAETLARRIGQVAPLVENTHRNAGFFVLLAPDVPAVLLEMGFMTNATDVARLSDARARQAMMSAVADSIDEQLGAGAERSYADAGAGRASFAGRRTP